MVKHKKQQQTRMLTFIIGILVVLIITLILTTDSFQTLVQKVDWQELNVQEPQHTTKIVFTKDQLKALNFLYTSLTSEYVACLEGTTVANVTTISSVHETEILSRDDDSIQFRQCPFSPTLIGTIHSHPGADASCELSKQDAYTFGSNQETLTCVACGQSKIRCYSPRDLTTGISITQ